MPVGVTYLLTFTCYGCHLHGDESGSVDREHNAHGLPRLEPNPRRVMAETARMRGTPYTLDAPRRQAVLRGIQEACAVRNWALLAAHVRMTHIHAVVEAEAPPGRMLAALKAYATRHLNRAGLDEPRRTRWTRHGSTRWLWKPRHISAAIEYVVREQGAPMSVYELLPEPEGSGPRPTS